ncbi:MAG: hypothetical protein IT394_14265 [Candidatus Omnitrophica bacterium]|nr:hypothetical protein [Candidatus Omnitrophota bacterium]
MQRFLATCIIGLVALGSSFNLDAASQPLTSPSSPSAGLAPQGSSVAILDLFNLSNDDQYDHWESLWGRGLRRVVFARKTLRLIEFPRIHAALQELKVDTYFISPDQVPPIAKKLGADFVVLGSFNVSQGVIAASLKVVDGKTGRLLKDETRFGSTEKPNDFTEDLNSTLLKILLGEQPAAEKAPASPATNEVISAAPAAPAVPAPTPVPAPPVQGVPAPAPPLEPGEIPIQEGPIEDLSAPPSPSAFSTGQPAPSAPPAIQYSQPAAGQQPLTVVSPIESEIPSLPRSQQAGPAASPQSPFQPMPVLPAPPPPRTSFGPPQQSFSQVPMSGASQMPPSGQMYRPPAAGMPPPQPQMPMQPAPVEQESAFRRFTNWITRPFRPAEQVQQPPSAAVPYSQPMQQQAMQPQPQMPMQPAPTPPPQGNAVTRFFGRVFGRDQSR